MVLVETKPEFIFFFNLWQLWIYEKAILPQIKQTGFLKIDAQKNWLNLGLSFRFQFFSN